MKAENKIYQAYFELKEKKLYYNQIKEYTHLSHSSLQNILKNLIKLEILQKIKTKSNTFYEIKNKKIFSLKFSEIAIKKFNNLNRSVKLPLKDLELSQNIFTVILFGSSSKKQEQKGSDIDLLVVSDKKQKFDLKKIITNYPISIFQCNINQFIENKDHIVIQARKGFPIYKEQNFYEVILGEYR